MSEIAELVQAAQDKAKAKAPPTREVKRRKRAPPPEVKVQLPTKHPWKKHDVSVHDVPAQRFAEAYLFGQHGARAFNAQDAYRLTHPTASKAATGVNAYRYLGSGPVQEALTQLAAAVLKRSEVEQDKVVEMWWGMAQADIFDYFNITEDEPGVLKVDAANLQQMPKHVRQNVKKLKITNRWIDVGDHKKELQQSIEIEIIDRANVVRDIARWLGMMAPTREDITQGLAELVQRAQLRAQQRGVTYDGKTGQPE
jgi:hypothetical protein